MMNKYVFILLVWVSTFVISSTIKSQTIDKLNSDYQLFVRLNNDNTDKEAMYTALYDCYKDYLSLYNTAKVGTSVYEKVKNGLRDIYPYLQKGAIYHSQKGNQQKALLFAQAYMDIPLMDIFKGDSFVKDDYYSTMAYFTASGTFNAHDYERAIIYFRLYLSTGDTKNRQKVFAYMAKSCLNVSNNELAKVILDEAITFYPTDFDLLSMAVNSCIDTYDNVNLQKYVSKALAVKPNDNTLLNIQGKLYEDTQDFQKALNTYTILRNLSPRSLLIAKHIAINYYNLGVMYHNKSSMDKISGNAKRYSKQSKEYFTAAVSTLKDILLVDPTSLLYTEALATAYNCIGNSEQLEEMNKKILSLGGHVVSASSVPALMVFNGTSSLVSASVVAPSSIAGNYTNKATTDSNMEETLPLYSIYAKEYVESRIKIWQNKDPYETVEEYQNRVTEETRNTKIKELLKAAEIDYIKIYTQHIRFNDMLLKPYDAENKVFLVESKFGELIVPVPRDNNEAKVFESGWNGMQFKSPKFYINNDKLALASLTFVTPTGNSYCYDNKESLNYTETSVDINFEDINSNLFAQTSANSFSNLSKVSKRDIKIGTSDVDINIPDGKNVNDKTFAIIISNENYDMVAKVPLAVNDGEVFSRYCEKTLGIPKNNVRLYSDASYGVMIRAVRDIKDIASAYSGDIQVVFYYAGHGIPNEATKDAFLLPVDADGTQTEGCYSLNRLYSELGALNAQSVIVFLDACFSGAKRDGGMLASARGIALKVNKEAPKGNMVVFSAASEDETAFPYKEKGHGLFTYYLLKKLQESKGNVTLEDLGSYISQNVKRQSVVVNRKTQTPTITPSISLSGSWKKLKLRLE